MKKYQVIAAILLFIGVAVAPCIHSTVVNVSNDRDFVKVTSQACGIQGFGNTTVKLTKEQCQDLQKYLVDFRARLNQTKTREEAIPIYKEAVVELAKFGLLPKGMSIEQAQRLVTGEYIPKRIQQTIGDLWKKLPCNYDKNLSILCLIYGQGSYPEMSINREFIAFAEYVFYVLFNIFFPIFDYIFSYWLFLSFLLFPLFLIGVFFGTLLDVYDTFMAVNPLHIFTDVLIRDVYGGLVQSQGINGVRLWQGHLIGDIYRPFLNKFIHPGVVGFTGFGLSFNTDTTIFIGSALLARIQVIKG